MSEQNKGLKIFNLYIEGLKVIKVADITPTDSIVDITGKNGAGKTTCLDSIGYVLGGQKMIPDNPIQNGRKTATVRVDLGEFIAIRKFTQKGSTLKLLDKDGKRIHVGREAGVLSKLIGSLCFDPQAFTSMPPKEQREVLIGMVDLGFDPDQMELERKGLYADRRDVNRDVKDLEARVGAIKPDPKVPKEEVSVAELVIKANAAKDIARAVYDANIDANDATECIEGAEAQIKQLQETIANQKRARNKAADIFNNAKVPDLAGIEARIDGAEETNRAVREQQERATLCEKLRTKRNESDAFTTSIEALDAQKEDALSNVDFPIPGLGFDEDGVTYRGFALGQASSAEQLRVSMGIAMAKNPNIRVILVRDGSLQDSNSVAVMREMTEGQGFQVWRECVAEKAENGFFFEEGELKEQASGEVQS